MTLWNQLGKNIYIIKRFLHIQRGNPPVHFMHIGKTGGTALKHALNKNRLTPNHTIFFHPHKTKLSNLPPGELFFFFLRDPVSRFVSGFYSRKRRGQPAYHAPWSSAEACAFARFKTPNELAEALNTGVAAQRDAEKAMSAIYHLRHPYLYWFHSIDYFLSRQEDIFFIGFQETLVEDFSRLKAKLQLPEQVQLPTTSRFMHRNPAHFDRRLSDRAVGNLRQWYADDYRLLDLCMTIINKKKHDIRH
jgi:hypothetical protein